MFASNLRTIRYALGAIICASILHPAAARSQEYISVAPGSKFICGHMPDGTNLIFTNNNGNYELAQPKTAVASVKRDISKNQNRIERLRDIRSSLRDGPLSKSEARALKKFILEGFEGGDIPKTKAERREAIDALIAKYQLDSKNKRNEISAIKDCSENKRPEPGSNTVSSEIIKFKALDGVYVALIMYVPAKVGKVAYAERRFCVRAVNGSKGYRRIFTANPCKFQTFSFPGGACPQFVPKGMLASFYGSAGFRPASSFELDDPRVIDGEIEFEKLTGGAVVSRPAATDQDPCESVP